jgi:hypothetical protein
MELKKERNELEMENQELREMDGDFMDNECNCGFKWEYPDAVKVLGKVSEHSLSGMIIAETKRRLPAVERYLSKAEENAKFTSTSSCTSPNDCFLGIWACEMKPSSAESMVATMECYDMDVYRHWEYIQYSAVFADGSIKRNCVPVGKSLADVLPSFLTPPVMIIKEEHLSGPSEIIDHGLMQEEHVRLYSIVKPLRGTQKKDKKET